MANPKVFLRFQIPLLWLALLSVFLGGCQTNPYTNRSQLLLMSAGDMGNAPRS
jgi:hypothetical protein